ncbi:unnamed protein product, partial [Onchocerca flexuosa]|uniref:Uncharacterized protein n=1 Tax=Onchocerca flexuosa TaxID=387005 RepID=A0A183HUH2_9BILA
MVNKGKKAKRMPHTLLILTILLSSFTSSSPVKIINSFNNNTVGDGSFNNNANQFPGRFPSINNKRPPKLDYPGFSPHIYSYKKPSNEGYLLYIEQKKLTTYYIGSQGYLSDNLYNGIPPYYGYGQYPPFDFVD